MKNLLIAVLLALVITITVVAQDEKIEEWELKISQKFKEIGFRMIPNSFIEEAIQKSSFTDDRQVKEFILDSWDRGDSHVLNNLNYEICHIHGWSYWNAREKIKNLFLNLLSDPKNLELLWKAKRNVILSGLSQNPKGKKMVEIFKKSLTPDPRIEEMYNKEKLENNWNIWDEMYEIPDAGDIGLTCWLIRFKWHVENQQKSWSAIEKVLNEKADFILQNL
jgi:hypothetical protein